MRKIPDISVVVLCYRSEEHLLPVIEQITRILKKEKLDFELVLVANYDAEGPRDKTPAIARSLALKDKRCTVVAGKKRGMMGWDLHTGLKKARGRLIAFLDGDGQTAVSDIVRLYRLQQAGNYDLCKVYRVKRADSRFRKISSGVFNLLFACFFPRVQTRDVNGKPKLMTRETYQKMQLRSTDWFADAEIMLETARLGLRTREIPGVSGENRFRKSFLGFSSVFEFLKNLVYYRFRYWFMR